MTKLKLAGAVLVSLLLPAGMAMAAPANGANDYLQSLSAKDQAAMLGKAAGRGCVGKTPFFMGMGLEYGNKSLAFWNVKCGNGASYVVQVAPDGSNQAMNCAAYEANNGGKCFKPFRTPDAAPAAPEEITPLAFRAREMSN